MPRTSSSLTAPHPIQINRTQEEAKSDLVNVLSSLEAHWHVLEAEVVEINRDIDYCEQCLRKYGEWFNSPLQYLRVSSTSRLSHTHTPLLSHTPRLHALCRSSSAPRRTR